MAITSKGYEGTINYTDWARIAQYLGAQYSVAGGLAASPGSGDRTVTVGIGRAYGHGIFDDLTEAETVGAAPVSSGSRWDTIALRRDWTARSTSLVLIPGASTKAITLDREVDAGLLDDQPLYLARFAAGQSAVQEIVDVRCWHGDGGMVAKDLVVRDYLNRLGTRVWINGVSWLLAFNSTGLPTWVPDAPYVGTTAPPYADGLVWVKVP